MKGLRTLIVFILFLFVSNISGQQKLDKLIFENSDLSGEIDRISIVIREIEEKILAIEADLKNDSISLDSLKSVRDSLSRLNKKEAITLMEKEINDLETRKGELEESVKNVTSSIDEANKIIATNNSYLVNMEAFRRVLTEQQFEKNMDYTKKAFSKIQVAVLDSLLKNSSVFQSMDAYDEYVKRLHSVIANKKVYDQGVITINSAFNFDTILTLRRVIIPVLKVKKDDPEKGTFKLSEEQFVELDTLDISLSRFKDGVKHLKKTINEINNDKIIKQLRATGDQNCKVDLQNRIMIYVFPENKTERFKLHQCYFKMIPYLEKMLMQYWEEVNNTPFIVPTKTESEILNIVVED